MLEELMSQYVDVDNKDFWDDSVSDKTLIFMEKVVLINITPYIGLQALHCRFLPFSTFYQHKV